MSPGLVLVCDPQPHRARADVTRMVHALSAQAGARAGRQAEISAGAGPTWAAAAIPPPGYEPTCGADVHSDGQDILSWAGEMFLPEPWFEGDRGGTPQRRISRAVLRRLQSSGVDVLADIDGAFCGAWYDAGQARWAVFNDKLGLLPVYYACLDDRLVVAPRAWLAWQAGKEPLAISDDGVIDLLRCENMADDHTLIEGVRWLEPGCICEWHASGSRCRTYWDFHDRAQTPRNPDEAINDYMAVLEATMRRHTSCEAALRLGISGGLDSRMLLAMADRIGRVPACFTAGWRFADDVRFGRQAARVACAPHDWAPLNEEGLVDRLAAAIIDTDGLHSVAHLAPLTAMRGYLSGRPGSVLLEGYLQGVLGGAYVPADDDLPVNRAPHACAWARHRLHAGGSFDTINGLLHPELAIESEQRWRERVDAAYRRAPAGDPLAKAEHAVASGRSGRIDVLGTALLREHALVRSPACDRLMLDWHARTPARLRRGKQLFMEVIRRRFPRLARVQRTIFSGLPVTRDPWLREYHWQREKVHRWWLQRSEPLARRWGTGGAAMRAWMLDLWRRSGRLDVLTRPDARVLQWVERGALMKLWDGAAHDSTCVGPLLALATAETMIRWLERPAAAQADHRRIAFRWFALRDSHRLATREASLLPV